MDGDNENSPEENKIREDYESVCSKLNMDQESMDSAWKSYIDIRDYYTLEVRKIRYCYLFISLFRRLEVID